jgi:predicted secreted protein
MSEVFMTKLWYGDMLNGKPGFRGMETKNNITISLVNQDMGLFNASLSSPQYVADLMYWGDFDEVVQWIADQSESSIHIEGGLYLPANYEYNEPDE